MKYPNALFKIMCLYGALALVALLAIGPFLHAHYGTSQMTGLHMAGVSAVSTASDVALAVTSFSQDEEPESAAVGVETSFSREAVLDVQEPPHSVWVLAVFVMATLIQRLVFSWFKPDTPRAGRLLFTPGLPSLAHAPPLPQR